MFPVKFKDNKGYEITFTDVFSTVACKLYTYKKSLTFVPIRNKTEGFSGWIVNNSISGRSIGCEKELRLLNFYIIYFVD